MSKNNNHEDDGDQAPRIVTFGADRDDGDDDWEESFDIFVQKPNFQKIRIKVTRL